MAEVFHSASDRATRAAPPRLIAGVDRVATRDRNQTTGRYICYTMGSLALRGQLLSPHALHRGPANDPSSLDTEHGLKTGLLECICLATCSRGFSRLARFSSASLLLNGWSELRKGYRLRAYRGFFIFCDVACLPLHSMPMAGRASNGGPQTEGYRVRHTF